MKDHILTSIPYVCAAIVLVLSIFDARLLAKNRRLKRKLRRTLYDCLAFHEIEARMSEQIALENAGDTALSVKRAIRAQLRQDGMLSPSEQATPHQIRQELERLL